MHMDLKMSMQLFNEGLQNFNHSHQNISLKRDLIQGLQLCKYVTLKYWLANTDHQFLNL